MNCQSSTCGYFYGDSNIHYRCYFEAAFSFFGKADDERDEAQKAEDEIILLLKKAKVATIIA